MILIPPFGILASLNHDGFYYTQLLILNIVISFYVFIIIILWHSSPKLVTPTAYVIPTVDQTPLYLY